MTERIPRRLLAGLDIGGSKVLAVAVDLSAEDGRARVIEEIRLSTFQGPEGVVDTAVRALNGLVDRLVGHPGQSAQTGRNATAATMFSGVGIGVPGLVDAERGAITLAVNLGVGAGGLALADRLRRRLHLPVVVENDVNAAALGAAAHLRLGRVDLAYLSIGTGLAAGIVLDGVLRRGPHNAAGEIGHVPVDLSGPLCGCGQHGCLEAVASGSAIAARWPIRSPQAGPDGASDGDSSGASRGAEADPAGLLGQAERPAQALFAAAGAGDPRAVAIRDEVAGYLAAAVRMLALTVDVDLVVLGGGVAEVGEPLRHAVATALDRQAEGSAFLRGLDLAARLSVVPRDQPVAAIGAALLAEATQTSQNAQTAENSNTESAEDVPA
jgi:glucokinase